jgi:hypothetical protein
MPHHAEAFSTMPGQCFRTVDMAVPGLQNPLVALQTGHLTVYRLSLGTT